MINSVTVEGARQEGRHRGLLSSHVCSSTALLTTTVHGDQQEEFMIKHLARKYGSLLYTARQHGWEEDASCTG